MNIYEQIQARFEKMCATGKLYRSEISGSTLWSLYLESFNNPKIFRDPNSSEHNCNTCNAWFRHYANIVAISEDNELMTLFDEQPVEDEYSKPWSVCRNTLHTFPIVNAFIETFDHLKHLGYKINRDSVTLGIPRNTKVYTKEEADKFGVVIPNHVYTFDHYHLICDKSFISNSHDSIESLQNYPRTSKELFKRALEEISLDTLELVRDLINQGSLLDGAAHLEKVTEMIKLAKEYQTILSEKKDNWCWKKSSTFKYARFKNELIGVLCTELAEGKELNEACRAWNYRVDPRNYMKATAPITQAQINMAMQFVQENGYEESFKRRCATLDDIKACDILHANVGNGVVKPVSIFDKVTATHTIHKRSEFKDVPEIPVEKFLKDILPTCTSVEAFVTSKMKGNLVTLTTSEDKLSKPIFKWNNNFSWTYNGNLAGKSQIKEAVKNAGGFVDAPFRFSIMWNEDGRSIVDLDAHAKEPGGDHIFFANHKGYPTMMGGMLDIDMIRPRGTGVENIFWEDLSKLEDGVYSFWIHNYDKAHNAGAKAEIYFNGELFQYVVNKEITENALIAKVCIAQGNIIDIKHGDYYVGDSAISEDMWNLCTEQFHKVNLICLSPNYWETCVGNKHYFFMIEGCKAPDKIRGFHNENLRPELLQHRKVIEVLGAKLLVDSTDKQLSGFGYNATVRDSIILRLKGTHNRVIKVKF